MLVAPPLRPPRPASCGVLFPLQTFNPAKRPVMAPLLPLPPHLLGLCGRKKRALHKRGGQCCEPPAMHLPPRDSDLRTWVGPSNSQPGRGYRVRVAGLSAPPVRWDSRVMGPEAWEVGHLCSSHPPPLSYFSMVSRGVPGIADPAARHKETSHRPEVLSSRSAQHQSHGD